MGSLRSTKGPAAVWRRLCAPLVNSVGKEKNEL